MIGYIWDTPYTQETPAFLITVSNVPYKNHLKFKNMFPIFFFRNNPYLS